MAGSSRRDAVVTGDVGRIAAYGEVVGLAGADLEEVVNLPSAGYVRDPSAGEPALVWAEGERVDGAPGEEVADVVGGVAVGVARHEEALYDGASAGAVFGVEPTAAVVEGFGPGVGGDGVPVVGEALLVSNEESVVVAVAVVGGVVPGACSPRDVFVGVDGGRWGSGGKGCWAALANPVKLRRVLLEPA